MYFKPGHPYPLGATYDGKGVNFALYSEHAEGVELCLFDENFNETQIPLRNRTAFVWHIYVDGIKPGQYYAYRVHGQYRPELGLRFNPRCLLMDPYAKALSGEENHEDGLFAYNVFSPNKDQDVSVELELHTGVADPAYVVPVFRESRETLGRLGEEQRPCYGIVGIDREVDSRIQRTEIQTDVELISLLPGQVGI